MSTLRLFSAVELSIFRFDDAAVAVSDPEQPVILSFPAQAPRPQSPRPTAHHAGLRLFQESGRTTEPLERARQLHQNRHCPCCQRVGTIPRDEFSLARTGDSMPVPGGGRLTGFGCGYCGHEWAV